jgi:uncharacterized protein (TIGR02001 family)
MECDMKLIRGLAAVALLATTATAQAEFSGTVTAVSDYNWRGITQTAQDPALQGSIDWAHDSGFYVGAWASNVDFGDCCDENVEIDLYTGFSWGETLVWDVGFNYYWYPGADDLDFPEVYFGVGYEWIEAKVWYSNDFANTDDSAFYLEGNATYELPANFGLMAHIGYSDGDGIEAAYGQDNYFDWAVGVTYALGNFELGLKYVDGSDLETLDGTPDDVSSSEGRAIFSVSTTFPWAKE